MARPHTNTDYHPRWLRRPVSTYWWLQQPSYFAFILRELSCIFVAWFVLYLLWLFQAVAEGEVSYTAFLDWSARPLIVTLNVVSLAFVVLHAITFFQAAPRAMVVHLGKHRVPERVVGAAHYGGLVAVSALVAWFLLEA